MFSEYASKFLAQSQSRLLGGPSDAPENQTRQPSDWTSRQGRNAGRSFLSRGAAGGNPYQPGGSRFGQLAFASRITAADDAPLFHHNGLPEFREEDDEDERDRDAADLYALQRSRRVAAASKLAESSETEPDASRDSLDQSTEGAPQPYQSRAYGRGIRSSWNGRHSIGRPGNGTNHDTDEADDNDADGDHSKHDRAESRNSKGKMVEVGLNSEAGDEDPPESLLAETPVDNDPPAFQQFRPQSERKPYLQRRESIPDSDVSGLPRESTDLTSENRQSQAAPVEGDIFKHDPFFAWLFLIMLAGLLSTTVLVWLNTSPPERGGRWGDTIYTTLHSSFHMLAIDTVISVMVSLFWLAALRSFVRPLVTVILVAVPVILTAFSLYPFISSFEGSTPRTRLQDRVLRWAAVAPAVAAIVWIYLVIQARRSIRQAVEILEFSSRILAANPALLLVGMASLVVIIAWTWLWLGMFTRVFLGGHFSKRLARFVISMSSWWLGVGFVLMYIWSLSVISAVQRATTGATVSQWYFHRNAKPAPTSREIVQAALAHATTTIFGTICESTFVSLLIRAPLLVLPSRLAILLARVVNSWIPSSVMALTNPLTVTYAAIHSQDLVGSARGLSQLEFISPDNPTTTLTPRVFKGRAGGSASPLLPYRLSKLLLMATRLIMATALGFAGWVITAKQLEVSLPDGVGIRGSAYAYVVGLVATFIGFSIMGAMEGILSGIVDAVVICYGSERRMAGGAGAYCLEAAYLFGDRRREVHGADMA